MNIRKLKDINPEEIYDEKDYNMMELVKNYVYIRDETLCQICGKIGSDCHHIIFRSLGGKNKISNLILLCKDCHTGENGVHAKKDISKILLERVKNNEKKFRNRIK